MPGEYEQVVGLPRFDFCFRNNRDTRTRRELSKFLFVHLADTLQIIGAKITELQDDVTFGRSTVADNFFSCRPQFTKQGLQFGTMLVDGIAEADVSSRMVQAKGSFSFHDLCDRWFRLML